MDHFRLPYNEQRAVYTDCIFPLKGVHHGPLVLTGGTVMISSSHDPFFVAQINPNYTAAKSPESYSWGTSFLVVSRTHSTHDTYYNTYRGQIDRAKAFS